jgi:2OG-Fe(II) oxygenase superfamily
MRNDSKWQRGAPLSSQGLTQVFDNKAAYIKVANFLSEHECQKLIQALREMGLKQYAYNFAENEAPPAAHLFDTHYLYEQKTPEEYFPKAKASIAEYQQLVIKAGFDPVIKVIELLCTYLGNVNIAEQDGQQYTYIIARELSNSALLHADFAPFLPPKIWNIANINAEYAWNIYLSDPGEGGECFVYNKPWEQIDDRYIKAETYGYDHQVVAGKEYVKIKPEPGMLLFFNSRNFHEVAKSTKPRLSLGGHVGRIDKSNYLFWV